VGSSEYSEPVPADRSLLGIQLIYNGFAVDVRGACDKAAVVYFRGDSSPKTPDKTIPLVCFNFGREI